MGFFSWNCKGCGKSLRSRYTSAGHANWMAQGVVMSPGGTRTQGEYDGYGCIGDVENLNDWPDDPEVWHQACWEQAGKPAYSGPSRHAADQGFFVGPEIERFAPGSDEKPGHILESYSRQALGYLEAAQNVFQEVGVLTLNRPFEDVVVQFQEIIAECEAKAKAEYEAEKAAKEKARG